MKIIMKIYKAITSAIGYVWNSFLYHLTTVLYFLFKVIYVPISIFHKVSFVVGFIFPIILALLMIKEYYPEHYTYKMCVQAHMDAGILTTELIPKTIGGGFAMGILFFVAFFLITRILAKLGTALLNYKDTFLSSVHCYEDEFRDATNKGAKARSFYDPNKRRNYSPDCVLTLEQTEMEKFKRSSNYMPPCKKFGYKKTDTTYEPIIK